jgi:hypothetical protein
MNHLFAIVLLLILSLGTSRAEPQLQRVPIETNYPNFLQNAASHCNACEFYLTPKPKTRNTAPLLAYVTSRKMKNDPTKSEIQAAYFRLNGNSDGNSDPLSLEDYFGFQLPTENLEDAQASDFYTGGALRSIATRDVLKAGATMVVSPSSSIDTSILIRNGGGADFIVEQQTGDELKFAANLKRLRDRQYSQKVTLFDFTPRSRAAVREMNLDTPALVWRAFSARISLIFTSYGKPEVIGQRSKTALLERLRDPGGAAIVLYAHSDGADILLDTDTGVVRLTPNDIAEVGAAADGRLPPVILLNCETRPILAPAFLAAGSPFVVTTDQKLGLFEAGNFVSHYAKALYVGDQDVIDAYFTAQQLANPNRLHPIVENEGTTGSRIRLSKIDAKYGRLVSDPSQHTARAID